MKIYRIAHYEKEYLTPEEREEIKKKFDDIQCSFAKDKDGYYCYTHRARSESYPAISKIPKSAVDFINTTSSVHNKIVKIAQFGSFEDIIYTVDDERESILREYYRKGRKKGSMMSWSVIPFAHLKKIWEDYSKMGIVRDEAGVNEIANQMLRILARLQAATDLSGHSEHGMGGKGIAEEIGLKPISEKNSQDFYWNFLETPYGAPVSDYGLEPLWKLANELMSTSSAEQKLLIIDQMLNVVHARGDLAALFIEGGSGALGQLSQTPEEESELKEASGLNWYKKAQADILYHVTHTKNVPKIRKEGIVPLKTSNWVSGKGDRYGQGEIFALNNKQDAIRWAAKMDWEFNQKMGSGNVSIVEFRKSSEWDIDEADPISQLGNAGKWLKQLGMVKPKDIIDAFPVTIDMIKAIIRR